MTSILKAAEPSIPDYRRDIIRDLEELKTQMHWAFDNPHKVTEEKMKDFKGGVKNLQYIAKEKIKDESFMRDLDRFHALISNLPKHISDIDKERMELIFSRLEKLIKDLG